MTSSDDSPSDPREDPELRARREAKELLAGFDRPGRSPRRARARDFVDHFAGARGPASTPEAPSVLPAAPPVGPIHSTFVKPELPLLRLPPWMAWAAIALVLVALAGGIAWLATSAMPHAAVRARPATADPAPHAVNTASTERAASPIPTATSLDSNAAASARPRPAATASAPRPAPLAPSPTASPSATLPSPSTHPAPSPSPSASSRTDLLRELR